MFSTLWGCWEQGPRLSLEPMHARVRPWCAYIRPESLGALLSTSVSI